MPRRRSRARPRRRTSSQQIDLVAHNVYSAGAGTINMYYLKMSKDLLTRPFRPVHVRVSICLRADVGMVPAESVTLIFNDAVGRTILKRGPLLLGGLPRTFNFRLPYSAPSIVGNNIVAMQIVDYGDNSKAGMVVSFRMRVLLQDPDVTGATTLVEKHPTYEHYEGMVDTLVPSITSSFSRLSTTSGERRASL